MRSGIRETQATVEETVKAGAHACDPEGRDDGVTALIESFEGDERPATAADDLAGELASTAREIDPEQTDAPVWVAAAAAHWIVTNPGASTDRERMIREGTRVFFGDAKPRRVSEWLSAHGLE